MVATLLLSVVGPIVLATVLVSIGHRLWQADFPLEKGRWSLALPPVLGAFIAAGVLGRSPGFLPTDSSDWALWLGVVATIVAVVEGALELPSAARFGYRLVLSFLTPWLVLTPFINNTWSAGTSALWVAGSGALLLAGWQLFERRAEAVSGAAMPAALTVTGSVVALLLASSGTALLGQVVGGGTATLGVIAVLGLLKPGLLVNRSLVGPVLVTFGGLLIAGVHLAEVSWLAGLVVGLIPVAIGLSGAANLPRKSWGALIAHGAVAAVLAGAAVGTNVATAHEETASDEEYDPYDY